MKSGRIFALIATGVMAAGALIGIAGAGPASAAATYHHLCVDGPAGVGSQCIDSELGTGQWIITLPYGTASLTNWTYPTVSNGNPLPIQQADNVNYCLQVDETGPYSQPADFEVIGAKCVGDTAEKWVNVYDANAGRTLFRSVWAESLGEDLCLSYSTSNVAGLFVQQCQPTASKSAGWFQQWGTT